MWSFLTEFIRPSATARTVIVVDEEGTEAPRRHRVEPARLLVWWGASLAAAALLAAILVTLTPLRALVPGSGTSEMRQSARLNALRIEALEDSLAQQQRYQTHLRRLMSGQVDSAFVAEAVNGEAAPEAVEGELAEVAAPPRSKDWKDHEQPALPLERLPVAARPPMQVASSAGEASLSSLQFPVLPPVEGFVTRDFDARTGHYAVDIAVKEGTVVHALGPGYVILADWTQEGGHAIAVQHADGYVSVYKHNERLLKRVGDRVQDREAIALSGNSGEITTGPHLHVELWHNGLAQNPARYFVGW